MIVVDASLAVNWFLTEAGSDAASAVLALRAGSLAAPDLIIVEVAAALVRRANMDEREADEMAEALGKWLNLVDGPAVKLFRTTPQLIRDAVLLAQTIGHPLKDCAYLALARELDCDFLTCDARFAAKAVILYPRTRLLEF